MTTISRRGLLGLSAAAGVASLAACTGTSGTTTPAQTGGSNTGSLRLFTYEGNETIANFKAQIAKFDASAGVKTTVDSLPGSGAAVYPDKLRTELLGGKGPDVFRIWGGQIGAPYAKAKQAMDLSSYYDKFKWSERINENAIKAMTFYGMKAGVPFIALGVGCWYSKDALTKAGTAEPKTYAELEAMNDKLVAAGITPLGTAGKYGWHIMRLYEFLLEHTAGPDLHDKLLSGDESWDRKEVVDSFALFKKWQDKKWIPNGALGLDPADVEPGYVQGKYAYTITGPWTEVAAIQNAKADETKFGNFVLPTDQSKLRYSGFVEGYMINAKSPNADKAAELIDYIVKPETQKALQVTSSTVKGAEPDKATIPLAADWAEKTKSLEFYTIQDQAFPKQQADEYFTVQSNVLQGSMTPAEAAKQMQSVVSAWAKSK